MTTVEKMKSQVLAAMKSGDEVTKNVLRVALSEISLVESSSANAGRPLTEEQILKIVRKIQASNSETIAALAATDARQVVLIRENQILESFLPKLLTLEEIKSRLSIVQVEICAAKNVGQATGVAMKVFKQSGDAVDGNLVKQAVIEIYGVPAKE